MFARPKRHGHVEGTVRHDVGVRHGQPDRFPAAAQHLKALRSVLGGGEV
jgi:hypothetical protein